MSKETLEHLNTQTLIGFTDKRGTNAWHYRADLQRVDPITKHVGNHYPGPIPIDHIIKRLFNWEAVECPLTVTLPNGKTVLVNDRKAIVHSKNFNIFNIFKEGYQPHQYEEWLLDNISNLLDDTLAIGSAGLLSNGAKAWVSVEVPDSIITPEGVEFRPNLIGTTSHDGTIATTYKRAIQLVVCDNTLDMALGEQGQQIKIRHTRNSKAKLDTARDALNIIYSDADEFAAEIKTLCETEVSDKAWSAFLDAHIPLPDEEGRGRTIAEHKRDAFEELWMHDVRVYPWKNTAFGVLQTGSTWLFHKSTVRKGAQRGERNMDNVITGKAGAYDKEIMAHLNKVLSNA